MTLLITNARILTEHHVIERGWLYVADRTIRAFAAGDAPAFDVQRVIDAEGALLAPGFIDLHVHGALGTEAILGEVEGLHRMSAFYARHGVTSYLPTTLTAPHLQIMAALNTIRQAKAEPPHGAAILGAHVEGPYLNRIKAGAQFPEYIRLASMPEAQELLDTGVVRLIAIAPEFAENRQIISACLRRGITVSIAHTAASYEEAIASFDLGISHVTHTYNAMTPLHHRSPGVVGAALADPRVRCEIICDLLHVDAGAVKVLFNAKGVHGTILITDAIAATGLDDGEYGLGAHRVSKRGKKATLSDGTLAGSVVTYDESVRSFVQAVGRPFEEVWPVTSLTPAQAIGEAHQRGSIALNKLADLVLLSADLHVLMTIVGGQVVYQRGEVA
jgi:N-acetylglucosamine-6-phosphate deacetylase